MKEEVLLSAFTAVETAHSFSAFCPSIFTIKSLAKPQRKENEIREGYIPAIIFGLVLSALISAIMKSKVPLLFAIFTIIFMVLAYEWALRS
jgi:hypothetical protein